MARELSETFYRNDGHARRALAEDLVDRCLRIVAPGLVAVPDPRLRDRLLREIMGALLLHGVQCP